MAKVQRSNMTQTDSQGKVIRAPRDNASGEARHFKWWNVPENEMAAAITGTIKFIENHQGCRSNWLTGLTRLYDSSSPFNLLGKNLRSATTTGSSTTSERLSFNVVSSVVDTLTAKMAKNKVVPTFVTNGGIWKYQKKAKQLTKFAQGLDYQLGIHDICIHGFRDAGVWGDGFTYVFRKGDKVAIKRVFPHQIVVDTIESTVQEPKQLHYVEITDRDSAFELYPELEENIALASPTDHEMLGAHSTAADLITITHSWHLRSSEDSDDGMKITTINNGVIVEDWDKDYFPFPHFRYSRDMVGWWSKGAAERLMRLQKGINFGLILKQSSLRMMGSFKVLVENGSKVVAQHLNNDVGAIINYTGTPPQYITPPSVNSEVQPWIDSLIQKAFLQEGVSQLSATGEKPLGVDSGKAMRTLTDIEDDRFTFIGQRMEDFVLENHRQAIEVVRDIYKDKKQYEVVFPTTNFLETVDWKDINLDASCYVLKAFPTSNLADDISGRLSDVQELSQAGMISPRTAKRLMDMPDVEMEESLSSAKEDMVHKALESIIYDQDLIAPEPYWDLQLAQQLQIDYYNYASYMNAPQEVLGMLEDFSNLVKDLLGVVAAGQQANQIAAQVQAQAQAAPANPTPTPTSNLLPNGNAGAAQQVQ